MKKTNINYFNSAKAFLLALALLVLLCGCSSSENTEPISSSATVTENAPTNNPDKYTSTNPQKNDGGIYLPGVENANPDQNNSVDSNDVQPDSGSDNTQPSYSYMELETIGDNEIDFAELP